MQRRKKTQPQRAKSRRDFKVRRKRGRYPERKNKMSKEETKTSK